MFLRPSVRVYISLCFEPCELRTTRPVSGITSKQRKHVTPRIVTEPLYADLTEGNRLGRV
jgi:hypothetical protein